MGTYYHSIATGHIPERWQAVGMHNGGFSHRRVTDHFSVNHSIIVRLIPRFRQTGNVTDRKHKC
jgi:transposase